MNEHTSTFYKGMTFLILAQLMVGINIVVSKFLLESISIPLLLTIRFGLATVILWPLHWLTPAREIPVLQHFKRLNKRDWFFLLAQALTAGVFFNFLMLLGLHYTDANIAGIITSALPAMIALMSFIILHEKISAKKTMAVLMASFGLLVIAYDKWQGKTGVHSFLGDALVVLALFPEAAYYILCKMHPNRLPVFLASGFINAVNLLVIFVSLFYFHPASLSFSLNMWVILVIIGLSSGLFYVFWFFGCQKVDGVMASLSTAVMPVSTVIFAWVLLGEQLSLGQFIGMSLVMLSIVFYAKQ